MEVLVAAQAPKRVAGQFLALPAQITPQPPQRSQVGRVTFTTVGIGGEPEPAMGRIGSGLVVAGPLPHIGDGQPRHDGHHGVQDATPGGLHQHAAHARIDR